MPITDGKYKNPGWVNNQKPAINAAELNAISTTLENLDAGGSGVGRSMAGETVTIDGESFVAQEGAEVFNDYSKYDRTIAVGANSHAEGAQSKAIGDYSHAEGANTKAIGDQSHSEGGGTHAEGYSCHAEGVRTTADGTGGHAEGVGTSTSGGSMTQGGMHAEGQDTTASGIGAHAEGSETSADGWGAHAEGAKTKALGFYAHAEGYATTAEGGKSHAEGSDTVAKGGTSHAAGDNTIANYQQYVIGTYNVEKDDQDYPYHVFIVGGGASYGRFNAFRVQSDGKCYGSGAWNSSGADYAELFEWLDGNQGKEDRAGLFVTLEGEHIRIAGPEDDYILGVVSAAPSVVGDVYDDQWQGMYIRDVFGRTVQEEQHFPARTVERPTPDGQTETVELTPACRALAPKLNPDYDSTIKYQPRTQRPEWDAVGLLGKLVAVDDGSCQVNGWATVGPGGRATASMERTKYRVMSRLDDRHIRVMIL